MSYRIGSLNCLNYNYGSNKNPDMFARIILDNNMDIIALQEIKRQSAIDAILRRLGKNWMGECDGEVCDYAFIWNTRRVHLPEVLTDAAKRINHPRLYKQYRRFGYASLVRPPYFARFTPKGLPGGANFEIRILNTHVRFSKGATDEDDDSPGAIKMRKNEVEMLTKAIYTKEADTVYGDNMAAYTILLGDYNLNKRDSGAGSPYIEEEFVEIIDGRNVKHIVTVQSELTTLKKSTAHDGLSYANNYDHVTYDAKRYEGASVTVSRIDAVGKYYNNDFDRYRDEVSDHLPILIELELNPRRYK